MEKRILRRSNKIADDLTNFESIDLSRQEDIRRTTSHIEISKFREALPQFLAVGVKNILLFGYGMSLGFPTIVIPAIQGGEGREPSDIVLNRDQISWFSSINLICVPLGCIFSGGFTDPIGKRRAMQLVNIPIIVSWLFFHFGTSINYLYVALILSGITGGLMEAPVLTYVAEISQPKYRGLLSASGSAFVLLGVFLQFVLGSVLDWRTIAAVSTLFPVISIITLFFIPDTPTWLMRKNRLRESIKALQWLRGWVPEHLVEDEFNELYDKIVVKKNQEIINENNYDDEQIAGNCTTKIQKLCNYLALFTKRSFISPFCLIVFTFFVGHFSGKTSLQTYAVQIFHTLKAPINKYHATILLGLSELISSTLCVVLVHFTGKRPLVFVSAIGVSFCFCGTATYAYYLNIVPGFAINNVVANASLLIPKESIISTDNITKIFEEQQKSLLQENNFDKTDVEFNETSETVEFFPDYYADDLNSTISLTLNSLNRTERDFSSNNYSFSVNYDDVVIDSGLLTEQLIANDFEYTNFTDNTHDLSNTTDPYELLTTPTVFGSMDVEKVIPLIKTSFASTSNKILLPIPKQESNSLAWLPLLLLLGAAFFAHLGLRLIPWMLIGEVFPANVRGNATGIAGGSGYILGFMANKLFLQMLASMTLPGTFWFYSAVALIGAIVMYFVLPETEGITLGQCEDLFKKNKKEVPVDKTVTTLQNTGSKELPIGLLEVPINHKYHKNIGKENKAFEDEMISRTSHF